MVNRKTVSTATSYCNSLQKNNILQMSFSRLSDWLLLLIYTSNCFKYAGTACCISCKAQIPLGRSHDDSTRHAV